MRVNGINTTSFMSFIFTVFSLRIIVIVGTIAVIVGAMLILRKFWFWYWKRNEEIELLNKLYLKLDKIENILRDKKKHLDE